MYGTYPLMARSKNNTTTFLPVRERENNGLTLPSSFTYSR